MNSTIKSILITIPWLININRAFIFLSVLTSFSVEIFPDKKSTQLLENNSYLHVPRAQHRTWHMGPQEMSAEFSFFIFYI